MFKTKAIGKSFYKLLCKIDPKIFISSVDSVNKKNLDFSRASMLSVSMSFNQ